jgi:hypothetical protein
MAVKTAWSPNGFSSSSSTQAAARLGVRSSKDGVSLTARDIRWHPEIRAVFAVNPEADDGLILSQDLVRTVHIVPVGRAVRALFD